MVGSAGKYRSDEICPKHDIKNKKIKKKIFFFILFGSFPICASAEYSLLLAGK